jgi:hypothetical protein
MAAHLRYHRGIQDLPLHYTREGVMSELSKLLDQASQAAGSESTGESDSEGGEMERLTIKALGLYAKHNTGGLCICSGCKDIRGVMIAYLKGWT